MAAVLGLTGSIMGTEKRLIKNSCLGGKTGRFLGMVTGVLLVWCWGWNASMDDASAAGFLAAQKKFPPWYERLVHFTRWPDATHTPRLQEIPDGRYVYEVLITEVLRNDVLARDWKKRVLRLSKWIPKMKAVFTNDLDAYLYRQSSGDGVLHICDTRPFLVVAFRSKSDRGFLHDPEKSFRQLTSNLLKIGPVAGWQLRRDNITGMFKGYVRFNVAGESMRSRLTATSSTGLSSSSLSFTLNYVLGNSLVIFEFQKFFVPRCDLNASIALFRAASAKPTTVEKVLDYFEGLKAPSAEDIPQLVIALADLPVLDPRKQRSKPYETRLLAKAKYLGYGKLVEALGTVEAHRKDAVQLVRKSLTARPSERDLRGQARKVERTAIAVLKRIGTPDAIMLLKYIAKTTGDSRLAEEIQEWILKGLPERQIHQFALEALQELANDPDSQPQRVTFLMRALPENEDPPGVKLLRSILQRTKNEEVRVACLKNLAEWITDATEVRGDILRILKRHLNDKHWRVRTSSVRAFGQSGDVRCVRLLSPLLDDKDSRVRRAAAKAISRLLGWKTPRIDTPEAEKERLEQLKTRLEPVLKALAELKSATDRTPK